MKHLLITTIAAVLLVGCGEVSNPEPLTAKAPGISIHRAAKYGKIEAIKQHLANGTDVNTRDNNKWTPLHYAAYYGHKVVAELLIAEGADVDAKSDDGWTPLHDATSMGHKEIVELLLAKGANVNAKNNYGNTPLDLASGETADLLRKHGGKTSEELKADGEQ
tara:strand:+ start:153 stop:641 length:489 start_codon:yes stop_codon:yes gene_type:complete